MAVHPELSFCQIQPLPPPPHTRCARGHLQTRAHTHCCLSLSPSLCPSKACTAAPPAPTHVPASLVPRAPIIAGARRRGDMCVLYLHAARHLFSLAVSSEVPECTLTVRRAQIRFYHCHAGWHVCFARRKARKVSPSPANGWRSGRPGSCRLAGFRKATGITIASA